MYVVKQYERGIVELFGKYKRFVEPGLHFQIPLVEITRIRDVREHTMDITPQPVITKDNVEIHVDGLIWVSPGLQAEDIKNTFYNMIILPRLFQSLKMYRKDGGLHWFVHPIMSFLITGGYIYSFIRAKISKNYNFD